MSATLGWGTEASTSTSSRRGFSEDQMARAKTRVARGAVSPNGTDRSWVVAGDARLGDSYPSYKIHRPEGTVNYHCSCYDHTGGDSRGRRVCSHIKAVIVWRKTPEGKQWIWRQTKIAEAKEKAQERRDEAAVVAAPPVQDGGGTKVSLPSAHPAAGAGDHSSSVPADPRDPSWGPLPAWLTAFRPHQLEAIEEILEGYHSGKRVMFVEAPTGSGKTAIGVGVARQLGVSSLYLASTKTLQDQIARDSWPGARILKGRANYPTLSDGDGSGWGEVTAADCTKSPGQDDCRWCGDCLACPYAIAKQQAVTSEMTVLNYAYALTDWNLARGSFAGRGLAILDEGDVLESELMGFVEVSIGKRMLGELKIGQPKLKGLPKGETVQPEWERWVREDALPAVRRKVERYGPDKGLEVRDLRAKKRARELERKLKQLADELPNGGWVYTDYESGNVVFKPVKVDRYGEQNLWRHAQRHLVMSATLISADEMADSLGLGDGEWGLVKVPSSFPAESRPIRVAKVADMGYKNRDKAWPLMCEAVSGVARLHPDDRVLVHAHTYALAGKIKSQLLRDHPQRRIVSYQQANEREGALARYLETPGAILVAASMDRGVDLPGDACRVQVVCKIPYPFLGDHQIKTRMYSPGGRAWYTVQAVRTLVQATGRGMRSADDHCVSYVLDSAFVDNLWSSTGRRLFPKWWSEALDWRFDVRSIVDE